MRRTVNYDLSLYDSGDATSYLTNYNQDNEKTDTGIKEAFDKGNDALIKVSEIELEVDDLTTRVQTTESDVALLKENVDNVEIISANALSQSISIYTHVKTGTEHNLINTDGDRTNNIKFLATADFNTGDTIKINGTDLVIPITLDGESLTTSFFKTNSIVDCFLNGARLTFSGHNKQEVIPPVIPDDIYSTEETLTNKIWIDDKPIYRKVVNTGALLTNKTVAHGIVGLLSVVSIQGIASSPGEDAYLTIPFGADSVYGNFVVLGDNILMNTGGLGAYTESYCVVEYTKVA